MQRLCFFLKENIRYSSFFLVKNFFDLSHLDLGKARLKYAILVNRVIFSHFVIALSPRNNKNGTQKNLKKQKY